MAVVKVKTKKGKGASFKSHKLEEGDIPTVEPLEDDDESTDSLYLRSNDEDDAEVRVKNPEIDFGSSAPPRMHIHSVTDPRDAKPDLKSAEPLDVIKVKFGSFVQLLTNRDLSAAIEANANEELIMKSNLLTELASTDDRRQERKVPLVFLIGIAIGVVLSYIFFST